MILTIARNTFSSVGFFGVLAIFIGAATGHMWWMDCAALSIQTCVYGLSSI